MGITTHTVSSLEPIGDKILIKDMVFSDRVTKGGIVIPGDDKKSAGIRPRWAEVFAVGPDQHDVKVGEWILVEHGRWTRGMDFEIDTVKMTIRMIDNDDIILVSSDPQSDDMWSTALSAESDLHRIEGSMHNNAGGGLF